MAQRRTRATAAAPPASPPPQDELPDDPHQSNLEAAAAVAGAEPIRWLQVRSLVPSKFNPRRRFRDIDQLAASIETHGLIEPLMARPIPGSSVPLFEIAAGERRWRACSLLVDQQRRPADWLVPVTVRDLTDAELIEIAGAENLDRDDFTPMEEARFYAALREVAPPGSWKRRPEEWIAARTHRGERTIFARLALLRLVDEAQIALDDGAINLSQAQALSMGEPKRQREVLQQVLDDGDPEYWDGPSIKTQVTAALIPMTAALFDAASYPHDLVVDPDTGEPYFADVAAFAALQRIALDNRIAELQAAHDFVVELKPGQLPFAAGYDHQPNAKKPGGVLIATGPNLTRVQILTKCFRRGDLPAPAPAAAGKAAAKAAPPALELTAPEPDVSAAPPEPPPEPKTLTQAQVHAVKRWKTIALRRALTDIAGHHVALALAVMGLLRVEEIRIRGAGVEYEQPLDRAPDLQHDVHRAGVFDGLPLAADWPGRPQDPAALFAALIELPDERLLAMLAVLVAERVGCWPTRPGLGDSALSVAIAGALPQWRDLAPAWRPEREWWAALPRARLERLAVRIGAADLAGARQAKKTELVDLVAGAQGDWPVDWFPELAIAETATIERALAAPVSDGPADRGAAS